MLQIPTLSRYTKAIALTETYIGVISCKELAEILRKGLEIDYQKFYNLNYKES